MSLTINNTPAVYSSFQDDLIFSVTSSKVSDPVTYPNFKYIADVYISGVLVARLKKIPDPSSGIGVFNIGQIVRSYAATVFNPVTSLITPVAQVISNGAFYLHIQMQFGESYSFTDFLNVTVDTDRVFFNNYNNRLYNTVSVLQNKLDQYATNRDFPNGKILFSTQNYFIPFMPLSGTTYPVVITPLLSSGSFSNPVYGTPYTTTLTIITPFDLQILNISPQAINGLSPGLLTPDMMGYTVVVGASATVAMYFICESLYRVWPVHFLNQYGGFDTFLFTKVSKSTFDINKVLYGKLQYTVSAAGAVTYRTPAGVYNETDSVYSSQYTENLELNSDLLSDNEYLWLKDLLLSPLIYLEDNGSYYCVQIQETNYEAKKNINDQLTNLNINLKFGNQLNAQFR